MWINRVCQLKKNNRFSFCMPAFTKELYDTTEMKYLDYSPVVVVRPTGRLGLNGCLPQTAVESTKYVK